MTIVSARSMGGAVLMLGLFMCGCGGGSGGGAGGGGSTSTSSTASGSTAMPASTWTVGGTIDAATNETATNVKVVASENYSAFDASTYAGAPASVTLSGSPPTASFSLKVDPSKLATPGILTMIIFEDMNDNGVNDLGEPVKPLNPEMGSPVWCDDEGCGFADFVYLTQGTQGTNTQGQPFSIDVTGWYASKGCNDDSCAVLIASDMDTLSGVKLTYLPLSPM